jgi:hypothetical protein
MPLAARVLTPLDIAKRGVLNGEFEVMKLEAAAAGKQFIYDAQQRVADAVVGTFADQDALLMTMVAPMQWGKTGVMAAVGYGVINHPTKPLDANSVYIITGMSDNDWREQTQERFPLKWTCNVMHRGDLDRKISSMTALENALFIIDECHYGAQADGLVDKFFEAIGLKSIEALKTRNVRIFQTSATPDNVLLEAEMWNQPDEPRYHEVICPSYPESYMSLRKISEEGRMLASSTIYDGGADELALAVNSFAEPKWHILRLPSGPKSKGKQAGILAKLAELASEHDWADAIHHHGATRIDDSILSDAPEKHTFILIKGLLRAAKTLEDTHIGVVYEPHGESKSDSSEAQGLPGRLCGHGKQSGSGAPILFCNTESMANYCDLMESEFNYTLGDLVFKSATVKKRDAEEPIVKPSFCNPMSVEGIEVMEDLCRAGKRDTPASHVSPEFATVAEARKWSKENGFGGIRARRLNDDGFYETPVPKDGKLVALVCDRDEIDVRGVGLTRQSPKRLLGFYTDKSDRSTLKFVINYRRYD